MGGESETPFEVTSQVLDFWNLNFAPESTEIGRLDHSEVAMAVREMSDRMLFAKRQPFLSQVGSGSDKKDREKDSEHWQSLETTPSPMYQLLCLSKAGIRE